MQALSKLIPIFPLSGTLLLPLGNLPLNIFEPKNLSMVNYALSHDKLIGMIQPKAKGSNKLFKIGCVGKITNYNETDDNRYLISLRGVVKFEIQNEINHSEKFKLFNVKYDEFRSEFYKFENNLFDKNLFIKKLKSYFEKKDLLTDWPSLENIEDKLLIITIAMISPFKPNEKQALLECKNMNRLADTIISLFDFSINQQSNYESVN